MTSGRHRSGYVIAWRQPATIVVMSAHSSTMQRSGCGTSPAASSSQAPALDREPQGHGGITRWQPEPHQSRPWPAGSATGPGAQTQLFQRDGSEGKGFIPSPSYFQPHLKIISLLSITYPLPWHEDCFFLKQVLPRNKLNFPPLLGLMSIFIPVISILTDDFRKMHL